MATHDYVIANQSGAAFRTDLNNALAAIVSNNSNSSSPSTTYAYQWWADTSAGVLKIRNSANNAWIELLQLDGTLTLEDGSASTPALAFRDDLNTGIFSSAADTFNVATGGVERMELGATTIFNEDGADVDFRIESDTLTHAFFLQASDGRIGINVSSPTSPLHISGDSDNTILQIVSTDAGAYMTAIDNSGAGSFGQQGANTVITCDSAASVASSAIVFQIDGNTERMRIDSDGDLLVGLTTALSTQAGSIQAAGPIIAKSYINAHTSNATVIEYISNVSRIRTYGATSGTGVLAFNTGGGGDAADSEAMRIDSSGRVSIGVTSASERLIVQTTANTMVPMAINDSSNTATETHRISFRTGGTEVGTIKATSGNTSFNTTSDYRLKENVTAISDGITRLKTLKPYRFNFIIDASKTVDGFFAHEVTAVPEAVDGVKDEVATQDHVNMGLAKKIGDPIYQGIDQSKLVPLLVAAVQELITKVETLEAA
jgi:hypothetical protein